MSVENSTVRIALRLQDATPFFRLREALRSIFSDEELVFDDLYAPGCNKPGTVNAVVDQADIVVTDNPTWLAQQAERTGDRGKFVRLGKRLAKRDTSLPTILVTEGGVDVSHVADLVQARGVLRADMQSTLQPAH